MERITKPLYEFCGNHHVHVPCPSSLSDDRPQCSHFSKISVEIRPLTVSSYQNHWRAILWSKTGSLWAHIYHLKKAATRPHSLTKGQSAVIFQNFCRNPTAYLWYSLLSMVLKKTMVTCLIFDDWNKNHPPIWQYLQLLQFVILLI